MKEFKIRASAAGQIMTNPRSKSDLLSKTAQTHCQDWLMEQLYNRKKEFTNKYVQKGLIVEDNAIDMYAEHKGHDILLKNEDYFSDDFMQGTPDIILPELIVDVKSVWSPFTMPLFDDTPPVGYELQAQVYMHLTKRKHFELAYCLIDTPDF